MKKITVILLTCIMIIMMMGTSYGASNTYEIKMETSKTEFFTGETIKIPVKIENINVENGIVAYSTLLSYDKNVLEEPEILKGTNWQKPNVIEDLIQSTTSTMQAIKENQKIMTISFKIKEDAPLGSTKIALLRFEASDGENTIVNEGASVEFNVTNPQTKVVNVILDNVWLNERNIAIAAIISIVTLFIIVFLTIYYLQHREKKETSNLLYEEVEGIPEEAKSNKTEEEKQEDIKENASEEVDSSSKTEEKE